MGAGAGELSATALGGPLCISTSAALLAVVLLTSLFTAPLVSGLMSLVSWFSLVLFSAEAEADSSEGG